MISPEEIKKQALKWWKPLLQSKLIDEPFFPMTIERIGKVQSIHITERFVALQQEIDLLFRHSKDNRGRGYRVISKQRNFRRTGSHELPDSIIFDTLSDYLEFTGKIGEWKVFLQNYETITGHIPELSAWVDQHCLQLTHDYINWNDILSVCRYFMENPRPNLYIRQLPVKVHTKYIEENAPLIQSLLDFLIPDHIRDPNQKRFAERYFLKYDQPLIRIRNLDPGQTGMSEFPDISIPKSDFEHMTVSARKVLITENKMNFLALPNLPSTIALWSGGGFLIKYLKNAAWLNDKHIFYWGDIDEHGYQILQQIRTYYPHTVSLMMDSITLDTFAAYSVPGARNKAEHLPLLNEEEQSVYKRLKSIESNRLEQEKITQEYAQAYMFRNMAI